MLKTLIRTAAKARAINRHGGLADLLDLTMGILGVAAGLGLVAGYHRRQQERIADANVELDQVENEIAGAEKQLAYLLSQVNRPDLQKVAQTYPAPDDLVDAPRPELVDELAGD